MTPKHGWSTMRRLLLAVFAIDGTRMMTIMIVGIVLFAVGVLLVPLDGVDENFASTAVASLLVMAFEATFFGWLLCIGLASNALAGSSRLEAAPRLALATFPIAVVYIGSFPFLISRSELAAVMVPLHLFSMFVNFFILWFASRSLQASELERPPGVRDTLGTFLLLWFAPLYPPSVRAIHERVGAKLRARASLAGDST